jgi:hypothetical protein
MVLTRGGSAVRLCVRKNVEPAELLHRELA